MTSVLKAPAGTRGNVGIVPVITSLGKPSNILNTMFNISISSKICLIS